MNLNLKGQIQSDESSSHSGNKVLAVKKFVGEKWGNFNFLTKDLTDEIFWPTNLLTDEHFTIFKILNIAIIMFLLDGAIFANEKPLHEFERITFKSDDLTQTFFCVPDASLLITGSILKPDDGYQGYSFQDNERTIIDINMDIVVVEEKNELMRKKCTCIFFLK